MLVMMDASPFLFNRNGEVIARKKKKAKGKRVGEAVCL